jgi:RhtB (resistance to homoserine/threonine) family protein
MELDNLAAFALIAGLLTIAPGADTILVIRNTVRSTVAGGITTTSGICSGLIFHALLSSLGLAMLLAQSALAYQGVKIAGAVYLVWLGIQSLRRRETVETNERSKDASHADPTASVGRCFVEGFVTNLLNPKVVLFYLAVVPQFVPPQGSVISTSLTLASVHAAMGIAWLSVLCVVAGRAKNLLARPKARSIVDKTAGFALIGLGLSVAAND